MKDITKKQLLIIKVGTNVLTTTHNESELLDDKVFKSIGKQARALTEKGFGVIIVSSGAITAGVISENKKRQDIKDMVELQRYAARGWDLVIQKWKSALGDNNVSSSLLTKREVHTESMRKQALDVISCCLSHGDVFIVNENDTISDSEIRFGDNDTLAAALAKECVSSQIFQSVKLIMLTNKNGLNRVVSDDNTLIRQVSDIREVEQFVRDSDNVHSRGGMTSKIQAARTATSCGVETYIANGRYENVIHCALNKQIGTYFTV